MKNMKGRIIVVALCFAVAFAVLKSADSKIVTNVPSDLSGEQLKAIVVEDFEALKVTKNIADDGWYLSSNPKEWTKGDDEKKKLKNPILTLDIQPIEGGPTDLMVEDQTSKKGKDKKTVLGVKFRFRYPGNNSISLDPPKEINDKGEPVMTYSQALRQDVQERAIQLPGRVRAISMWVHARGFPYTIELWVKDYKGDVHILQKQSINFVGWRPMIFEIPDNVPQTSDSYPVTKITKLVKIVIREVSGAEGEYTRTSSANSSDIFVFIDQIKVLTDTYEVYFDGQELHDKFKGSGK